MSTCALPVSRVRPAAGAVVDEVRRVGAWFAEDIQLQGETPTPVQLIPEPSTTTRGDDEAVGSPVGPAA